MTIATSLPRHQGMIDRYASGESYKTVAREFRVGEHRLKAMILKYVPEIMRTRSEQGALSATANKSFCLEDLDQVEIGPCAVCSIPLVGECKMAELQTCGLCVAARAA